MVINLWRNNSMDQWRWTLTDPATLEQHSGGQEELRNAMNDVANTVEYILDKKEK